MEKFLLALVFALPMVLVGCKKENVPDSLCGIKLGADLPTTKSIVSNLEVAPQYGGLTSEKFSVKLIGHIPIHSVSFTHGDVWGRFPYGVYSISLRKEFLHKDDAINAFEQLEGELINMCSKYNDTANGDDSIKNIHFTQDNKSLGLWLWENKDNYLLTLHLTNNEVKPFN